jgi:cysteinyl-tRNA synthetase
MKYFFIAVHGIYLLMVILFVGICFADNDAMKTVSTSLNQDATRATIRHGSVPMFAAFQQSFEVTPQININNKEEVIDVSTGDKLSLAIKMEAKNNASSANMPLDWWIILVNPTGEISSFDLSSMSFQPGFFPLYQGNLICFPYIILTTISDLPVGQYQLYFAVDALANAQVDIDSLRHDSIAIKVFDEPADSLHVRLNNAMTWMYQIQGLDEDGAVETLAESEYPMLVLEPGNNFRENAGDTVTMISQLRYLPDGKKRLLIAYVDIGQAEDYRDYWQPEWVAPTADKPGMPDFLVTIDPDGWSGNYPVAYWDQRWKALWLGDDGIVAQLARLGFDGIYLDWVEAYDDEMIQARAAQEHRDAPMEMIRFVAELGAAGRAVRSDFLVIVQNAPYLIDADSQQYSHSFDALAVEDTWFHGAGDAEWNDPQAGDLHERHDGIWSTENRLSQYQKYLDLQIPVFSVDYCLSEDNARQVYNDARKAGLRPLVTRVSLSRLTEWGSNLYR